MDKDLEGILEEISGNDFDVKDYTSYILEKGISSSYQLSRLTSALSLVESAISNEVFSKHDALILDASRIEGLEERLEMLTQSSKKLLDEISAIRNRLQEPYNVLKTQVVTVARLQVTCDTLRDLSWYLELLLQLENETNLIRQAEILAEVDSVCSKKTLDDLNAYTDTCQSVAAWHSKTEEEAIHRLETALKDGAVNKGVESLQVFDSLGLLSSSVYGFLDRTCNLVQNRIRSAVSGEHLSSVLAEDRKKGYPGRTSTVLSSTRALRSLLWEELEETANTICSCFDQVSCLDRVIGQTYLGSNVTFATRMSPKEKIYLLKIFWSKIIDVIRRELKQSCSESGVVKQSLEEDFPRFLKFVERISKHVQDIQGVGKLEADIFLTRDDVNESFFEIEQSVRSLLAPFQNAYLSQSLSRLFDPVNSMFQVEKVPLVDEIDTLIAVILSEMKVSEKNGSFHLLVSKNIIKCLKLFNVKCETLIVSDSNASQVTAIPNAVQKSNGLVFALLIYFRESVKKHIESHLSEECREDFNSILETSSNLMRATVQPLLDSISDSVEAILLTMHQEDFSAPVRQNTRSTPQCSLYLRELQGFILRVSKDYLGLYGNKENLQPMVIKTANRCFDLFLRHTSLVRPLGEGGKLRMAADFAQMELALAPLGLRLSESGQSYKAVKAFKSMLFNTLEDLVQSPLIGEVVPYSVVLHFIFAQSPPVLKSPHQTANWSITKYSQWLDEHQNEKDRLLLVRGALDAYAHGAKAKNVKLLGEFEIMLQLVEKGLNTL
ncbi:conserved oligomeric Golgi complex subunit 5-like [Artemia franciscana]|uniref:Conserved oligomeric Golgi complex subunit 5 n=1 Tax=Artemia franciscana TaxID=6661 RepID=A0AA88L8G6_ARTSF|nr:hypothetical protein QYM36_002789 [Artemia franciscana]